MTLDQPGELTILEAVNAVEPIQRLKTCPLGLVSHGARLCPLHRRIDNALALVEEAFGGTTLRKCGGKDGTVRPFARSLLFGGLKVSICN